MSSNCSQKELCYSLQGCKLKARELDGEERRFHASLPLHAQNVLRGKRIATKSPFFDTKIAPATSTLQFALISARWQRKKFQANNIHKDDPELSKVLQETTMSEVELDFLQGPFQDIHQVREVLGQADFVCSRRFAKEGKPRIIDDLKESGVDKAFAAGDKVSLHDIDYVAPLLHFITSILSRKPRRPKVRSYRFVSKMALSCLLPCIPTSSHWCAGRVGALT